MNFAAVVFNIAVDKAFHYQIPPFLRDTIAIGKRVRVRFRNQFKVGFVVGFAEQAEVSYTKPISAVLDDAALVDAPMIALARWMADRYLCSWGQALHALVPPGVRTRTPRKTVPFVELRRSPIEGELRTDPQQRIVEYLAVVKTPVSVREVTRHTGTTSANIRQLADRGIVDLRHVHPETPLFESRIHEPIRDLTLTGEQLRALAAIRLPLEERRAETILLHGVTGSGKTEVYLRAIQHAIRIGRSAIVLVPEIALTPQTVSRFRARFERIAVLHSMMTESDRAEQWRRAKEGAVDVVVGARSAVFAPIKNLGLIVLDEEQENTYKQESDPRYHARDVAMERARQHDAVVVLGSATPSLETYHRAKVGIYHLCPLPKRVENRPLPRIEIVDLQRETADLKFTPVISRTLGAALDEAIARHEQVILFLNRRGFASYLRCPKCGHLERCPRCDTAVTFHRESNRCLCHYCLNYLPAADLCPKCRIGRLKHHGFGTERVEDEIRRRYPQLSVRRLDSDAMKTREDYESSIGDIWSGAIDIVVGTQMIAKGLDVPNVTLVGVISADTAFNLPDFRSSERTFQLVTQVAGRAGRGDKGGRVIVQTFNPTHYSIVCAATHNYSGFAEKEIHLRRELGYPPFTHLIRIVLEGAKIESVVASARELETRLRSRFPDIPILGPHAAPLARIRGKHRIHLLLKCPQLSAILGSLKEVESEFKPADVRATFDIDPVSML